MKDNSENKLALSNLHESFESALLQNVSRIIIIVNHFSLKLNIVERNIFKQISKFQQKFRSCKDFREFKPEKKKSSNLYAKGIRNEIKNSNSSKN